MQRGAAGAARSNEFEVFMREITSHLLVALCLLAATTAQAREAPRTVALSTGSNIATWTLPATPAAGVKVHQTPVIYLHGGPGMYTEDRRIEMGQAFRAAGFNTIFYDQIGGGQSARVPAVNYTLARMIADLEALRISLGAEKIVLWGNSWGAQLAVLYAQAHPNRLAGFVLTSPGNFPGENFRRNYSLTKRTSVTIGRELTAAINQIDRKGGAAEPAVSQVETGRMLDAATSADLLEGMVCKASTVTQADLPGGGNLFANRMIPKEVAGARVNWTSLPRVPALIVRGSCDFVIPESASRYVAVTGGTRVDVPNVGHGLLEDPAAIERILGAFAREGLASVP
jgi:pimeloyl-ACP methyl ester carboxylesterase